MKSNIVDMKVPDKIYIDIDTFGFIHGYNAEAHPPACQEYIRKDALMEWANSWLAFKRSGVVLDDGFSYAMEELIKKLNEM